MPGHPGEVKNQARRQAVTVSVKRVCYSWMQTGADSVPPRLPKKVKGGIMTSAELKARQLVTDYGRDMAISQAKFFLGRADGGLQTWWTQVLVSIRSTPNGHRTGLALHT